MTRVYTRDEQSWHAAYAFSLEAEPGQDAGDTERMASILEDMAAGNGWNVLASGNALSGIYDVAMELSAARAAVRPDGYVLCEVYTEVSAAGSYDEEGQERAVLAAAEATARGCQRKLRQLGYPQATVRLAGTFHGVRRPAWARP